jgi:hypothetical protein
MEVCIVSVYQNFEVLFKINASVVVVKLKSR